MWTRCSHTWRRCRTPGPLVRLPAPAPPVQVPEQDRGRRGHDDHGGAALAGSTVWGRLVDVAIVDTVVLGLSRDVYFNKYGAEVWADPETCHPNSTSN